jgi:hypothetical protein
MRIAATFLTGAVVAAMMAGCQPAADPAPATPVEPTAEEMGQDDPEAVFTPAPVGPPRKYDAMSKTAMSLTPGVLTLTPTPQKSVNLPEGAVFQFGNGYILDTTTMPGGAVQGTPLFDFTPVFVAADGQKVKPDEIAMYSVDDEIVPPGSANGGFCDKTSFLATYSKATASTEEITIAAFNGDQWPPVAAAALCGTFTYSRALTP